MRQFKPTERITPRSSLAIKHYLADVSKIETISQDEELELAVKAKDGDVTARNKLINANLRFVISVAKMYTRDESIFNDVVSAGNIGLVEAVEKFDHTRGFKFISFAVWYIRKEIIKYLSNDDRIIRTPINRIALLRTVREYTNEYKMKNNGVNPTIEELHQMLKDKDTTKSKGGSSISVKDLEHLILTDNLPVSFDSPVSQDSELTFLDVYSHSSEDASDELIESDRNKFINDVLNTLSERERYIIKRFHGFDVISGPVSFPEIAKEIGLQAENTRRIYKIGIRKMRVALMKMGITQLSNV